MRIFGAVLTMVFLGAVSNVHAGLCDGFISGLKLLFESPDSIEWTRRIDLNCKITNQGMSDHCWAYAGRDAYTAYFRSKGILGPNEVLSIDYYIAKRLEVVLRNTKPGRTLEYQSDLDSLEKTIAKYGIVTEQQYRFPKQFGFLKKDLSSALVRFKLDIDRHLLSPEEINRKYLALDHVVPRPLVDEQNPKIIEVGRATMERDPHTFFDWIKTQIDSNLPVFAGFDLSVTSAATLYFFGNSGVPLAFVSASPDTTHAVLIVGYRANAQGEIERLLVRNSMGTGFGKKGLAVISIEYFKKYFSDFYYFIDRQDAP